jgi:hypothetical protein
MFLMFRSGRREVHMQAAWQQALAHRLTPPSRMPRLGDIANACVLVNTSAFLAFALADSAGLIQWASPSFRKLGFCVANPNSIALSSHMLCFYTDTVFAIGFMLFVRRHKETMPGIKGSALELGAGGIFGHGAAHLGLAFGALPADGDARVVESGIIGALTNPMDLALIFGLAAFYYSILRSAPNVQHALPHSLLHGAALRLVVPGKFGFTYVQTTLLWIAAAYDMRRASKDRFYDLNAALISLPVGLVSWAEALACDSFMGQTALTFKSIGGHVWYDACVPLSMLAYCAVIAGGKVGGVNKKRA